MKVRCLNHETGQDYVEIPRPALAQCRVCGLDWGYCQPWEDGEFPTYDICPCCFMEAGYDDISIQGIKGYRQTWIENGAKWSEPNKMPEGWSLESALASIPSAFK